MIIKLRSVREEDRRKRWKILRIFRRNYRRMFAVFSVCYFCWLLRLADADPQAERLYNHLFKNNGYNRLVRPVANNSESVVVWIDLQLSLLVDVDEKNQIVATNVWLKHSWKDYKLQWNPNDFGGIRRLNVPSVDLWRPDIVLYNNADGNYEIVLLTKATVHSDGTVVWRPPAIYKSSCPIIIEYFPFDMQICSMKFGSWTYDYLKLDLQHITDFNNSASDNSMIVDVTLDTYQESVEWDLLSATGRRNLIKYPCCPDMYPDITFNITLRRKTLFYTVNLIIPCVSISFLTVLVFYLPADSGEKVALCISILLSLTVFFLLLAEIIPPTSLVVPLIGKYLLLTIFLLTLSIIVTVINLNIYYHPPSSTGMRMPAWMKRLFLDILPQVLMMQRPSFATAHEEETFHREPLVIPQPCTARRISPLPLRKCVCNQQRTCAPAMHTGFIQYEIEDTDSDIEELEKKLFVAISGLRFVAENLKREDAVQETMQEWKYAAMVFDRLCLWVFTAACVMGTMSIIMQAPSLYDDRKPVETKGYGQGYLP